jgi:hypothetical protein
LQRLSGERAFLEPMRYEDAIRESICFAASISVCLTASRPAVNRIFVRHPPRTEKIITRQIDHAFAHHDGLGLPILEECFRSFFSEETIYVFYACPGDRLRCKLLGIVSPGPLNAKSSQCASNQARIAGEIVGLELRRSLIRISHSVFSASSDFQPSLENSTMDPSWCFQVNEKFISASGYQSDSQINSTRARC